MATHCTTATESRDKGILEVATTSFSSDTFLWLTLASIALSATIKVTGRTKDANFVGEWAPTFLGLGIISKLTKIERMLSESR